VRSDRGGTSIALPLSQQCRAPTCHLQTSGLASFSFSSLPARFVIFRLQSWRPSLSSLVPSPLLPFSLCSSFCFVFLYILHTKKTTSICNEIDPMSCRLAPERKWKGVLTPSGKRQIQNFARQKLAILNNSSFQPMMTVKFQFDGWHKKEVVWQASQTGEVNSWSRGWFFSSPFLFSRRPIW